MDFSQNFFAGNQPYHFIGVPPLTPSHSNSAGSEDFNTTSPPEVYAEFPNEQFQNFDAYAAQFGVGQPHAAAAPAAHGHPQQVQAAAAAVAFPSPPTDPGHAGLSQQQQQQQQQQQAAINGASAAIASLGIKSQPADVSLIDGDSLLAQRNGSNSGEDDELTPAQSRRKAQNRAAQRAFRERKERHVKDLEAKLAHLEEQQNSTVSENERLKRDLQKMSTENEILRATSGMPGGGPSGSAGASASLSPEPLTTGPMQYNPTDFYSSVLQGHQNKTPSHRIVTGDDGERLLAAGATWDLIISHDAFKRGMVDVGDVSERLRHRARCDGQGPVFSEREILEAIEQSAASGSDELL